MYLSQYAQICTRSTRADAHRRKTVRVRISQLSSVSEKCPQQTYSIPTNRCEYCDYRSSQKNTLTRHLRVHTGGRPFHCSFCDFRGRQKSEVVQHASEHHRNSAPLAPTSLPADTATQARLRSPVKMERAQSEYCLVQTVQPKLTADARPPKPQSEFKFKIPRLSCVVF